MKTHNNTIIYHMYITVMRTADTRADDDRRNIRPN